MDDIDAVGQLAKRPKPLKDKRSARDAALDALCGSLCDALRCEPIVEEDESMIQVTLKHASRMIYYLGDQAVPLERRKVVVLSRETGDQIPMGQVLAESAVCAMRFIAAFPNNVVDTIVLVHLKNQGRLTT